MSDEKITPANWEQKINGNAPDEPEITPSYPGQRVTSPVKWKKIETISETIPVSEERMNKFDRNRKHRKEGR